MAFTQTVDQAIAASYLLATGKAVAPTSGTAKYTKLLALLNMYTQVWAGETGTDLSLIHISEPTRPVCSSRMPSYA